MSLAIRQRVDLGEGITAALELLPAAAGVAEIEGPGGKSLLLTRSANIRKWAAANLGQGPAVAAGKRPKVDLAGVATAVSFALAPTPFERTLVFERWMAPLVPYSKRKDLRPPFFLRLDPAERFPRVNTVAPGEPLDNAFGPFRDRKAAERASAALHKVFPLRPCDHVFEPAAELPLGRACLYSQVRSCAAPCLLRVSDDAYRAIALDAVRCLAAPAVRAALLGAAGLAPATEASDSASRPQVRFGGIERSAGSVSEGRRMALLEALPSIVSAAQGRGLVVSKTSAGGLLHPVSAGRVLDGVPFEAEAVEAALEAVRWESPEGAPDDWPWLATWLHSPAGRMSFVVATEAEGLAAVVREVLSPND